MITYDDYLIILKLEANPLLSYSDLADELGVSWPTAKRRVKELIERGIIRTPVAIYDIKALGLKRISWICFLEDEEKLVLLERLCDIHPYTHYRGRGYGNGVMLLIQFDIPIEVTDDMEQLRKELIKRGYCLDIVSLASSGQKVETFPDLNYFDPEKKQWNFTWEEWITKLTIQQGASQYSEEQLNNPDLQSWEPIDFMILREITKDPTIKQAEIMRKFKLTRTEAHRRYNNVFRKLISDIRFRYDRITFDLVNTRIFWVDSDNLKLIHRFYNLLKNDPPPFRLGMDILTEKGFLLWGGGLPSFQEHQLAFTLWKLFKNFKSITLDTSVDKAAIYWFYPDNFDFDKHYWKTDTNYVLKQPLTELEKLKKNSQ